MGRVPGVCFSWKVFFFWRHLWDCGLQALSSPTRNRTHASCGENQNSGFPGSSAAKEYAYNAEDPRLIARWGRSSGGEHGNLLRILAWRIPMDRGGWLATVHGITETDTAERLSTALHNHSIARKSLPWKVDADVAFGVRVGILSMVPQPGCRGISVPGPGYPVGLEPFPWLVTGLSAEHSVQSIPAPAPAPDTCTTPVE